MKIPADYTFLAQGGFGRVFANASCVLKVPRPDLGDALARLLFCEEIDHLLTLRGEPGVAQIVDYALDPLHIVMQRVHGERREAAIEVALASFAKHNLIHTDLHAGNILVDASGNATVIDLQRCVPGQGFSVRKLATRLGGSDPHADAANALARHIMSGARHAAVWRYPMRTSQSPSLTAALDRLPRGAWFFVGARRCDRPDGAISLALGTGSPRRLKHDLVTAFAKPKYAREHGIDVRGWSLDEECDAALAFLAAYHRPVICVDDLAALSARDQELWARLDRHLRGRDVVLVQS